MPYICSNSIIFSSYNLIFKAILFYLCFFFIGITLNNINIYNILTLNLYEEAQF